MSEIYERLVHQLDDANAFIDSLQGQLGREPELLEQLKRLCDKIEDGHSFRKEVLRARALIDMVQRNEKTE